jgi:hypothetical protein
MLLNRCFMLDGWCLARIIEVFISNVAQPLFHVGWCLVRIIQARSWNVVQPLLLVEWCMNLRGLHFERCSTAASCWMVSE